MIAETEPRRLPSWPKTGTERMKPERSASLPVWMKSVLSQVMIYFVPMIGTFNPSMALEFG